MNVFADLESVLRQTGDGRRHVIGSEAHAASVGQVPDTPPPDPAKVQQVHALLNRAAYEYELEPLAEAMAILETLTDCHLPTHPSADEEDEEAHHGPVDQKSFAGFVGQTVDDEDSWPVYRRLAVNLHKLHLEGLSLERVLAQMLAVAIRSGDAAAREATLALVPPTVTWDILAFNLACMHAVDGNKERMLEFTRAALRLGKDADQFRDDSDFEKYLDDPDFTAVLKEAEDAARQADEDGDADEDESGDDPDEDGDSDEDDPQD